MAEPRWCHSKMWRLIYVCNCSKLLNSAAPVLGVPSHPTRRPHSLLMIKWHPDLNLLGGRRLEVAEAAVSGSLKWSVSCPKPL